LIGLLATLVLAAPVAGLELRPLSRGDLAWVAEDRTSGVAVGEWDGFVRPSVQAFAGAWTRGRVGAVGTLGIARLATSTWSGEEVSRRAWMVVRPGAELRLRVGPLPDPTDARPRSPRPWLLASAWGDIPAATDRSTSYTAEEQEAATASAAEERARLGGLGAAAGAAVELPIAEGLSLGARWAVGVHRGVLRSTAAVSVSTWTVADAALLLSFEWPRRSRGQ
jgi:hypothetical protein